MAEFKVKEGVVVLNGKGYKRGEAIQLSDEQAKRLKAYVEPVEGVQAEAKVAEPGNSLEDLNFDELKALAESKELQVEGTGKNGAVKKDDLINALAE